MKLSSSLNPEPRVPASADILERFCRARDGAVRLSLEPAYFELLEKLGNPHKKLPPILHVAGTNGKGSTCAFLRAILEAAGKRAHVYTSPHLVHFHERIRIAGELISEEELVDILSEIECLSQPGKVSDFEAATAAAFVAFTHRPADAVILEVGMGGRFDATNVIDKPAASIIARLSYDHRKYLGNTLAQIAREKAGIMRAHIPCFIAPQREEETILSLRAVAGEMDTPLKMGGIDWKVEALAHGFRFTDDTRDLDLPTPALLGEHQLWNAGLAIASLPALPFPISDKAIAHGMRSVEWPARLQPLREGRLKALLPNDWELWLDGGHNDSAGAALALQMDNWQREDNKPLTVLFGMLTTKEPREFLAPLIPYIDQLYGLTIPHEPLSFLKDDLVAKIRESGFQKAEATSSIEEALRTMASQGSAARRVLICGSLYLAGDVLKRNGAAK